MIDDLYLTYHKNTELHRSPGGGFDWFRFQNAEVSAERVNDHAEYPALNLYHIHEDGDRLSQIPLSLALKSRRSERSFSEKEISFHALSEIVESAAGITGEEPLFGDVKAPLRAYPSAGGLASANVAVVSFRIEKLGQSLAYYDPINRGFSVAPDLDKCLANRAFIELTDNNAAAVIVLWSRFDRLIEKYGQRGYRYALIDVGHLAQNLYLSATGVGLNIYSSCGFVDRDANSLLRLDGIARAVTCVMYIGCRDQ